MPGAHVDVGMDRWRGSDRNSGTFNDNLLPVCIVIDSDPSPLTGENIFCNINITRARGIRAFCIFFEKFGGSAL